MPDSYVTDDCERSRLTPLNEFDIFDFLSQKEYDSFTQLARSLCNKPVAQINFISTDHQLIKSSKGVIGEVSSLDDTFCHFTIQGKGVLEIKDATLDTRVSGLSCVISKSRIRFYAGTPLISSDGLVIGALSVTDTVPGELTDQQKESLFILAETIVSQIEKKRKYNALKNIIHKYQDIDMMFNSSAELHCIFDREGKVMLMNNVVVQLLGYSVQEVVGKTIWSFINEADIKSILSLIENGLKSGERNFELEARFKLKSGGVRWMGWSVAVRSGKWFASGRDITERKKSEDQLKLLSLVASKTINGVAISSSDGRIKWVNKSLEDLTGYTLEDFRNTRPGDLLSGPGTDMELLKKARTQAANCIPSNVELLSYKKDGTSIWLSISNTPTFNKDGSLDQQVEIINDISERKLAEQELIKTREEALSLSKAKEMFLSVMSHEIRTPLNAVIGMSHILMDDDPSESQMENLEILSFSAQNLLALINDILDYTKIETGNMKLESVNVNLKELVSQILNSLQFKTEEKQVVLKSEIDHRIPEFVIGDNTRLYQILINLLSNSLKFTEKGEVKLKLDLLDENDNSVRVRFEVSDTGIGISDDQKDYIFHLYTQASSDTTRKYGGTGLGLAITKSLLELHNSEIHLESELGRGSVFSFIIEFKRSTHSAMKIDIQTPFHELSGSVLVVDDNEINRLLASKVLGKWGLKVCFAENGQIALQKVQQEHYDLILMDLHMPVMDGMESSKAIRQLGGHYAEMPIVALTASLFSHELETINECGMDGYVIKPFIPNELYAKVRSHLLAGSKNEK